MVNKAKSGQLRRGRAGWVCVCVSWTQGCLVLLFLAACLSRTTLLSLVPCDCGVNGRFRKPDITSLLCKGEVVT